MKKEGKVYYYVYRIDLTTEDGKHYYYLGKHKTRNLEDNYMGSGSKLRMIRQEHKIVEQKRTILQIFDTNEECLAAERSLVSDSIVVDKNCLNVIRGGGSFDATGMVRMYKEDREVLVRPEDVEEYEEKGYLKGSSKSTSGKISEAHRGRIGVFRESQQRWILPEELEEYEKQGYRRGRPKWILEKVANSLTGHRHSLETRKKLSEVHKNGPSLVYGAPEPIDESIYDFGNYVTGEIVVPIIKHLETSPDTWVLKNDLLACGIGMDYTHYEGDISFERYIYDLQDARFGKSLMLPSSTVRYRMVASDYDISDIWS